MDHGLVSLAVIVSTAICGDGLDGGGASVCPGKAGLGFRAISPAKRLALAEAGACARTKGNIIVTNAATRNVFVRLVISAIL